MPYRQGDKVEIEIRPWGKERISMTIPCCNKDSHPPADQLDHPVFAENGLPVKCPDCKWTWHLRRISDDKGELTA